ncbi:MAG: RagB/SusD family nutrient uptake outer membrane protein, partial [Flavisolibacter sp.]
MKFSKYLYSLLACVALLSCKRDVLDRPPLTDVIDGPNFWRNESDVRLYATPFYPYFFTGFNTSSAVDYTPVRGYTFSDDLTGKNVQSNFESSVPTSRGSSSEAVSSIWMSTYAGPTWNFAWVRKSNILIDRLNTIAKPRISEEAYNHWTAVGKFFRGFEYSRLVSVFGDVPYFDKDVPNTDLETLYKDRDDRGVV